MHPVNFEGAVPFGKPQDMTDEQCSTAWAVFGWGLLHAIFEKGAVPIPPAIVAGVDSEQFPYYLTAWQPNKEDIEAINRGEPIYVKTLSKGLPPMALFTLNENKEGNF